MTISSNDTILTNGDGRRIFGDATAFREDFSLCALFRAIVLMNESHEDIEALVEKTRVCSDDKYEVDSVVDFLQYDSYYPLAFIEYCGDWDDDVVDIEGHAAGYGWETFDAPPYFLNRYLSQISPTKVYINREKKKVCAIVKGSIRLRWVQAFCSMLWVVLPWYFPGDKKEEFVPFFRSISVDNKDISEADAKKALIDYVNRAAATIDIRSMGMRRVLTGVADTARKNQIEGARNAVRELERLIRDKTAQLQNAYSEIDSQKLILKGLEMLDPQKDDDFFEFFDNHRNVSVEDRSGTDLVYSVTDTLEFYDEDELRSTLANKYSWARDFNKKDIEWIKTLLLEKRGIVRINACFTLRNMALVVPRRGDCRDRDTMPNPHIFYHACSGGNEKYYSEYAKTGEWQLAIEQSIAATKNWAPGDSTVSQEMFSWLIKNEEAKCIFVTDGSPLEGVTSDCKLVTIREYKDIVKKKIESENAQKVKESEETING